MQRPVANGISQGGVADVGMPVFNGTRAGNGGGSDLVEVFDHLLVNLSAHCRSVFFSARRNSDRECPVESHRAFSFKLGINLKSLGYLFNRSLTFKDAVKNGFNGWPITITWRDVIDIVDDIRNEKVLDDFTKQNLKQCRVKY